MESVTTNAVLVTDEKPDANLFWSRKRGLIIFVTSSVDLWLKRAKGRGELVIFGPSTAFGANCRAKLRSG
jgi:hypothetical protein